MPNAISQISKNGEQNAEINREISELFFEKYSKVDALSRPPRKPGEATSFFHESRRVLDRELKSLYDSGHLNDSVLEEISVCHSILSLIHWLYPNYIGYNRLRNALWMQQHSSAAMATSRSKTSLSYGAGLVVQLRITPFLIRSKKSSVEHLANLRQTAIELLQSPEVGPVSPIQGMVSDALGFSYFLFERNIEKALSYLVPASEGFASLNKNSRTALNHKRSVLGSPIAHNLFFSGFAAAALWDLGMCYETKAETSEGEEMLELTKKARTCYLTSLDFSRGSPWHLYRAMSAYNLAGAYFREGLNEIEKKNVVRLLKESVSIGEESLRWFRLWSSYEADFLGGSWIASYCQGLANFSSGQEKRRLMGRSIELAKKAEELVANRKVGLARYKIANLGDIYMHHSEYYRQLAIEKKFTCSVKDSQVAELLKTSLVNCLKGRGFFRSEQFKSRKIDSSLLAGDVCYELMTSPSIDEAARAKFSRISKRYFREVIRVSVRLGLNEKMASSHWRIAQVLDREGRYSESASQYNLAQRAYEGAKKSARTLSVFSEPAEYMSALADIENAKLAHRRSEFERASELYRRASNVIRSTRRWQTRSLLYAAESFIEEAEKASVQEDTNRSIERFEQAIQSLTGMQNELKADSSPETRKLVKVGSQLSSFCSARVVLEKSKRDYRTGDTQKSINGLSQAENVFSQLADELAISDLQHSNELSTLSSLCRGLKNLELAQAKKYSKLYLSAEEIFAKAANESKSSALTYLLSGLSDFASFLYSSLEVEESLENTLNLEKIVECDRALDSAARAFWETSPF